MGESYYPACEDCRRSTGMNCGKHGHAYIIEGGSTLPLLAERQYAYDRIAALIADRDAALAERDRARVGSDRAESAARENADRAKHYYAALTEARRVLREVEWVSQHGKITGPSIPEWAWCPCCGKTRQDDHTPAECALAAVLAQEKLS